MKLSSDLISQFAKVTKDNSTKKSETTVNGTVKKVGDKIYVQLDGSELLTPVSTTADVNEDERAIVQIKDHTATIIGNISSPSARTDTVKSLSEDVVEANIVLANKVDTVEFNAQLGIVNQLIANKLDTAEANIKYATISELTAAKADITKLQTDKLDAHEASITYATIDNLKVTQADVETLKTDKLDAYEASIKYATITNLDATNASIKELDTKKLDTETADIKYATIDFSNIDIATIGEFFANSGVITDVVIKDGNVTGVLAGVTIKGDLIEGGTVVAEKLVIKGDDGLYYKLNTDGESVSSEQTEYNSLNGSVITAKTITADKVNVTDLVAFGATIGGYHIDDHSLYSGSKADVSNTTQGVFLGDDGQVAFGDADTYLKFYVDENSEYKLEIQADSIRFGTGNTNIEDAINEVDHRLSDEITNTNDSFQQQLEEYKTNINAELSQTKDGFNMTFTDLITQITNVDGTVNEHYAELKSYIEFAGGTITLGEGNSPLKLILDNEKMSFKQNNVEVAYISDNKLYIRDGEFLNSLTLGRWVWIIEQDDGLSLNYI